VVAGLGKEEGGSGKGRNEKLKGERMIEKKKICKK
jgi:hypothetical protein